jgi:voltage-gated potassium channel
VQLVQEAIMIKHLLSQIINSNKNLTITFCLIISSAAFFYSISEKTPLLDALWWAIVTATTVGYGDSFPHHMLGKVTAITLMLTMVLLVIPAITARMASGLIVNHDAFTHEEQEELKQGLRKIVEYIERNPDSQSYSASLSLTAGEPENSPQHKVMLPLQP